MNVSIHPFTIVFNVPVPTLKKLLGEIWGLLRVGKASRLPIFSYLQRHFSIDWDTEEGENLKFLEGFASQQYSISSIFPPFVKIPTIKEDVVFSTLRTSSPNFFHPLLLNSRLWNFAHVYVLLSHCVIFDLTAVNVDWGLEFPPEQLLKHINLVLKNFIFFPSFYCLIISSYYNKKLLFNNKTRQQEACRGQAKHLQRWHFNFDSRFSILLLLLSAADQRQTSDLVILSLLRWYRIFYVISSFNFLLVCPFPSIIIHFTVRLRARQVNISS